MRQFIYIVVAAITLCSCEDFLDSTNKTGKDSSNFPQSEKDASQLLTGVYSVIGRPEPLGTVFLASELMSDDRLGGGGPDDKSCKAIDQFKKDGDDTFNNSWRAHYFGVFRSNYLISKLPEINWKDESVRKKIQGEVHFLRAYFYFDLIRLFGQVPLVTTPDPVNIPKSPAKDVYALIASDLQMAIENLPDIKFQQINRSKDLGRATKWAAEALMARVFLFYTGYYQQTSLPLPDGKEISRQQVSDWIVDCIDNSGHDLIKDFRNLWAYSYVKDYKYTADHQLKWIGDGHQETVFAIKYSSLATDWESPQQKSNQFCLYFGLRGQPNENTKTFPFGKGWGMGTLNPKIVEDWDDNDIRKKASVFQVTDKDEINSYNYAADNLMDQTLYWQKKYLPINVWTDSTKTSVRNFSYDLYGMSGTDYMRDNIQDLMLIRFSDVLLMAAELGTVQAQTYLDRVRNRVNLPSVVASLENIKKERRFELAFEGVRYYDLLRWHEEHLITENQTAITTYNRRGQPNVEKKNVTFRPETGGFLPIPQTQIDISGGVLTQNAGWIGGPYLN